MNELSSRPRARAVAVGDTLDSIRRIVRALRVANSGIEKDTGLTAAQLFVLEQVVAAPHSSLSEIAHRTMTDRTSVAAVVDRLVARGLVARERSTEDRRRVELAATEEGRSVMARAPHPPTRRILAGLESLDDRQLATLALGLGDLVQAMGLSNEPAAMLFEDDAPIRAAR